MCGAPAGQASRENVSTVLFMASSIYKSMNYDNHMECWRLRWSVPHMSVSFQPWLVAGQVWWTKLSQTLPGKLWVQVSFCRRMPILCSTKLDLQMMSLCCMHSSSCAHSPSAAPLSWTYKWWAKETQRRRASVACIHPPVPTLPLRRHPPSHTTISSSRFCYHFCP